MLTLATKPKRLTASDTLQFGDQYYSKCKKHSQWVAIPRDTIGEKVSEYPFLKFRRP